MLQGGLGYHGTRGVPELVDDSRCHTLYHAPSCSSKHDPSATKVKYFRKATAGNTVHCCY